MRAEARQLPVPAGSLLRAQVRVDLQPNDLLRTVSNLRLPASDDRSGHA
jgi:hypothetical protein